MKHPRATSTVPTDICLSPASLPVFYTRPCPLMDRFVQTIPLNEVLGKASLDTEANRSDCFPRHLVEPRSAKTTTWMRVSPWHCTGKFESELLKCLLTRQINDIHKPNCHKCSLFQRKLAAKRGQKQCNDSAPKVGHSYPTACARWSQPFGVENDLVLHSTCSLEELKPLCRRSIFFFFKIPALPIVVGGKHNSCTWPRFTRETRQISSFCRETILSFAELSSPHCLSSQPSTSSFMAGPNASSLPEWMFPDNITYIWK